MSQPSTISIIGLYKSGTTWLLSALCKHPDIVGIREFDVVRAITGNPRDTPDLKTTDELLTYFFCRSPWCKIGMQLLERTKALTAKEAVNVWARQQNRQWEGPSDLSKPQTFFDLDRNVAAAFLESVRNASSTKELAEQFSRTLHSYSPEAKYSLMKAADQLAVFDRLKVLMPETKHVLIMRDGRDASISAFHYRQLMASQDAPWRDSSQERDTKELLKGWVSRARMARKLLNAGEEIYVLRYEDLTHDFHKELGELLKWIGIETSSEQIQQIKEATDFKNVTGRDRGTEAKSVVRKGEIGEWKGVFSDEEKEEIWSTAGDALTYFGYSKDGEVQPFPSAIREANA